MLAAEDNMQIVSPTTPAQYFHVLRRQVLRRWRKPLVVMTPKSLLRHPAVVSSLDECAGGGFQRIIPENETRQDGSEVQRVLLCSGKVYYDLAKRREEMKLNNAAIVRVEQLYPLRDEELESALKAFPDGTPAVWVQEEPENGGAWRYLRARFGGRLFGRLPFTTVCRPASASPASGSHASHKNEQQKLIEGAFGGNNARRRSRKKAKESNAH
jgi:2-oxoglutarate dehydrogenase E1 component